MTAAQFSAQMNSAGECGGGCFSGSAMIRMSDGSSKEVKEIKKGDMIATPAGEAQVKCVLKFNSQNNQAKMCQIGGLQITPHHPIQVEGQWVYPSDVAETRMRSCDAVYNMVVDNGHIAILNGVPAILLGHDYT